MLNSRENIFVTRVLLKSTIRLLWVLEVGRWYWSGHRKNSQLAIFMVTGSIVTAFHFPGVVVVSKWCADVMGGRQTTWATDVWMTCRQITSIIMYSGYYVIRAWDGNMNRLALGMGKVRGASLRGGNLWGVVRGMRLLVNDFPWPSQFTHFRCLPLDVWNVANDELE